MCSEYSSSYSALFWIKIFDVVPEIHFCSLEVTVPTTPNIIGIILAFIFHIFSSFNAWYFSNFSYSFFLTFRFCLYGWRSPTGSYYSPRFSHLSWEGLCHMPRRYSCKWAQFFAYPFIVCCSYLFTSCHYILGCLWDVESAPKILSNVVNLHFIGLIRVLAAMIKASVLYFSTGRISQFQQSMELPVLL